MPANSLRPPKGLLFDLGGTIIDFDQDFDIPMGNARILELAQTNPEGLDLAALSRLSDQFFAQLPDREALSYEHPPFLINRLVYEPHGLTFGISDQALELSFYEAAYGGFFLLPGIAATLEALSARQIPMGIVSNSSFSGPTIFAYLNESGLGHHFRFKISTADYGFRKPHPYLLKTAAKMLGYPPADLWYVGDKLVYDVAGAHNAGMGAVWYNPDKAPLTGPQPGAEVHTWSQYLDLVLSHIE